MPEPSRLVARLAVVVAVLAGATDLGGALVLDDEVAIAQSACVTGSLDLARIFGSNFWCEQEWFSIQSWRPLIVLGWWVLSRLGPPEVVLTLFAIALHVGCVVVGLRLARQLGLSERAAALGMLVFAALAIHAEALALAVGTADLAAALLVLLCLWGFAAGRWWCVVPGVAAVLCKETGVLAVPLLAVVALAAPRRDRLGGVRQQALAIALVTAGVLALLVWRASVIGAWTGTQIPAFVNPFVDLSAIDRVVSGIAIVGRYHRVAFLGGPMSGDYAYDAIGVGASVSLLDLGVGIGCALVYVVLLRSARLRVLALWGLGTSAFVSNVPFVLPAVFAERLFYLPSVAVALLLGEAADRALSGERVRPLLVQIGVGGFVLAHLLVGIAHTLRFRDQETLVRHTVETTPRNARARVWLAQSLVAAGEVEEARAQAEVAASIRPEWGLPIALMASMDDVEGRPERALQGFRRAAELDAADPAVADLFIQFLLRYGHRQAAVLVYDAHVQARGAAHPDVTDPRGS